MSWIEDRLRDSLGRRQPSDGFADRVMERIKGVPAQPAIQWPRGAPPRWRSLWWNFAAIAACLAMLITGGLLERQRQQREREKEEAAQVFAALQLTAGKLQSVRARIVNTGFPKKQAPAPGGHEED